MLRTRIFVNITPRKSRNRRRADIAERAQQVLTSFRSYLMASVEGQESGTPNGPLAKMKHSLLPWLHAKK